MKAQKRQKGGWSVHTCERGKEKEKYKDPIKHTL